MGPRELAHTRPLLRSSSGGLTLPWALEKCLKGSDEMSKRNNLAGFLRDVGDACNREDLEVLKELTQLIDEAYAIVDDASDADTGVEDAEPSAGGEPPPQLGVRDRADRAGLGGAAAGHDSHSSPHVVPSSGMVPSMGGARAAELARAALPRARGPLVRARGGERLVSDGT